MDRDAKRNPQVAERELLNALNEVRRVRGLKPLHAPPKPPFCSFCGEGKDQAAALVEGLNAFICDRCAAEGQQVMRKSL